MFDGGFCRRLIELGRADAKARRDELLEFFGDAAEDARSDDEPDLHDDPSDTFRIGT
jgi:NTE family protein